MTATPINPATSGYRDEIARLFQRLDRTTAEQRAIQSQLDEHRRRYSDAQGYRVPLRIEALRREIGA